MTGVLRQKLWGNRVYRYFYFQWMGLYTIFCTKNAVVSYRKSGHTWVRVMLAKVLSLAYGIEKLDMDLVKMARGRPDIPKIAIVHSLGLGWGIYPIDWRKLKFTSIYSRSEKVKIGHLFNKKRMVFLVRDPRDVVVSLYFELTKRHSFYNGSLEQFIREKYALKKIVNYMNLWYIEMQRRPQHFMLLRYEDMQKDTARELRRVVDFFGLKNVSDDIIMNAVEFGSIGNMRKLETQDAFTDSRLRPLNKNDTESYKVRKGKVGGYKDYLGEEDIHYMEEYITLHLQKEFGYGAIAKDTNNYTT